MTRYIIFLSRSVLISLVFVLSAYTNAPDSIESAVQLSVGDMDGDGVPDSLIYDKSDLTLTVKLSSTDFEPYTIEYPGVYESGVEIQVLNGGFAVHAPHMRASNTHTYFYEQETGRFHLAGYWHEHIHCGWMNVDLVSEKFTADWHQDSKFTPPDSLVYYPPVDFPLYYDPIYLGDPEPDFMSLGYNLLGDLESIYTPPRIDTVRFLTIESTFDENDPYIPDEYLLLMYYVDKTGQRQCDILAADGWPTRDDLVEITTGYVFYHDTNDSVYVVQQAITELNLVRSGVVSGFSKTNTKRINLEDETGWAEQTGELIYDGVIYFVITTADKKIKKYMDRPGTLEVVYYKLEVDNFCRENNLSHSINMDVYNLYKGRKKYLGKYVLGITRQMEFLYYDKKLNTIGL